MCVHYIQVVTKMHRIEEKNKTIDFFFNFKATEIKSLVFLLVLNVQTDVFAWLFLTRCFME